VAHAVRQSLLRGEWPLWNPYLLCGGLLAANLQSTVYDPLHLLALLLPHPQALTFGAAMTSCSPARWPSSSGGRSGPALARVALLALGAGTIWLRGMPGAAGVSPDLVRTLVLAELLPLAALALLLIATTPRRLALPLVLGLVLVQRTIVDGARVPLDDATHAFLGVRVPEGVHRLQLAYRPESFTRGLTISALAVAALVVAYVTWRARAR
jgi:hypothetical protein